MKGKYVDQILLSIFLVFVIAGIMTTACLILFLVGCNEPTRHPENLTRNTYIEHSLGGEVIDHHTKEAIPIKAPRYVLMYVKEGMLVNGHYYKSIKNICNVYCNYPKVD